MSGDRWYLPVIVGLLLFAVALLWLAPGGHVVVPAQHGDVCPAPEPTGTQ